MKLPRPLPVLWALLALALLPAPARAQEELSVVLHPVTLRTIEKARTILDLDHEQAGMVRDLYQGYHAAYKAAMEDAQAKIQALHEKNDDPKQHEKVREQTRALVAAADKLDAGLLDDIKSLLGKEQAARFGAFERARRRETLRAMRIVAGDNVDLIDVLEARKVPWRRDKALAPIVEEYDLSLDRLVGERRAALRELFDKIMKVDNPMELDENSFKDTVVKMYDLGKKMRDCNRGAARRLGEALPADQRSAFDLEVRRRTYPRVYGPCKVTRVLAAAAAFKDLSESQRAELDVLKAGYEREAAGANAAWVAEIDRAHEEFIADPMKALRDEISNQDALQKARVARQDIDQRYAERLDRLLTKEQNSRLPAPPPPSRHEQHSEIEPDMDEQGMQRWLKGEEDHGD